MAWDGLMMLRRAPPVQICGYGCGPMAAPREGVMSTRQKESKAKQNAPMLHEQNGLVSEEDGRKGVTQCEQSKSSHGRFVHIMLNSRWPMARRGKWISEEAPRSDGDPKPHEVGASALSVGQRHPTARCCASPAAGGETASRCVNGLRLALALLLDAVRSRTCAGQKGPGPRFR